MVGLIQNRAYFSDELTKMTLPSGIHFATCRRTQADKGQF